MRSWSITFFVVAIFVIVLGVGSVVGTTAMMAPMLFSSCVVLFTVLAIRRVLYQ